MTIGQVFRKILGRHFPKFGNAYRALFVNLRKVAEQIAPHIPQGAMLVDVGGGSGHLLNQLLAIRQDIQVKMLDLSENVGNSVQQKHLPRVERHPETSMREFSITGINQPLAILISDVIHHVPQKDRKQFFSDLKQMISNENQVHIIIKDVEPGYIRSLMGFLADRYISGDKNVSLIGHSEISDMMLNEFGNALTITDTGLFEIDKPNFSLAYAIDR